MKGGGFRSLANTCFKEYLVLNGTKGGISALLL